MRAEKDSAGEEGPGDHGPTAGDVNPLLAGVQADVAEIEHGRVNHHLGILQQRVQTASIGPERAIKQAEWPGGEVYEREKKDLHASQNYRSVSEEARVSLVAQTKNESVGGQQKRPEQQRTFLPGPQHGKLVRSGQIAVAVMKNVGDGEVVLKSADDQDESSKKNAGESGDAGTAGSLAQALRATAKHRGERAFLGCSDARGAGDRTPRGLRLLLERQRDNAGEERVNAQRQGES